jgi:hypothetical protein
MVLLDVLQERQAINLRHVVIGHHGVIPNLLQLSQRYPAILSRLHCVTVTFQVFLQHDPNGRIIVYQEKTFSGHWGFRLSFFPSLATKED